MAEHNTTFEEAKLCPRCGLPGEDTGTTPVEKPGAKVHVIWCRNSDCKWFNTNWLVMVNADGTIPEPYSQIGEKQYPGLSQESETRVNEALQRQLDLETQPGTELINPHSNR